MFYSLLYRIELFFSFNFIYYFLNFCYILIKFLSLDKCNFLFINLILNQYFLYDYSYHYNKGDFKTAYRSRIKNVFLLYGKKNLNTNNEAKNYISLIDDVEFYKFLEINQKQIYFKNNFNHKMNYYFDSEDIIKITYTKILMVGPLSNLELENFNGYDLLVFNKIPADHIIDLNVPIIICTGNLWMRKNYKRISELVYKHKNISIFSTTKSKKTNYSHTFDKLPSLPFKSSLMNFQRTLCHIQGSYKYQRVDIIGYNFFLSETVKNDWYQNQAISQFTNNKENIIYSTRIHDYFINFIFVKNFLFEHNKFKGEIREIVNKDYNSICKLLHKFYYE